MDSAHPEIMEINANQTIIGSALILRAEVKEIKKRKLIFSTF
jgi:hypothetical protein